MDRNAVTQSENKYSCLVALRKESVDRNLSGYAAKACGQVALRKESVDRNISKSGMTQNAILSLSARRAWIEMPLSAG